MIGVRGPDAVVTQVSRTVEVCILLIGIVDRWAVVAEVAVPVGVGVLLLEEEALQLALEAGVVWPDLTAMVTVDSESCSDASWCTDRSGLTKMVIVR